ncbi:MAG: hypothetical protein ACRBFS_00330 [Aureispira sp.]
MELLDDFSQLNQQYDPKASERLEPLSTPEERFLWTGRPKNFWMDFSLRKLSKKQRLALVYTLGAVVLFLFYISQHTLEGFFFLLRGLGVLSVLILLLIIITEAYQRHRTFYGITKEELWVRKPNKRLIKYHISSLELLALHQNSICYSSQANGTFKRHFIFQNIPQAKRVFDLVWQLYQEDKKSQN